MDLNKGQYAAVHSDASKLLILAGAGTGKTYTMLSRISRLVSEGVNPHDILVLTFTNAAAFEMEERYKMNHKGRVPPSFSTFHAFCYRLIVNDDEIRNLVGYTDVPSIPDEHILKEVDTSVRQQCGTKLSSVKISGKGTLTMKEQFEFDLYWKKFKQVLKQRNLITFDIMCYDVCKLFTDFNPVTDKYKDTYKHIFVDEFQDTDPKQWAFVSSFKDANVFIVGDVFQSIYGFRGADSSIIKGLSTNKDWETIRLVENYRSTKQICNYANRINIDAFDSYRLDLESIRDGEDVCILETPYTSYVNPWLREVIADITLNLFGTVAILARTNAEVNNVKRILDDMGVMYNTNNNEEHVVGILKSVLDNEYMVGWLSTKLNSTRYVEWIKLCTWDEKYKTFDEFYTLYYNQMYIHEIINTVSTIRRILRDEKLLPYQRCVEILKELGLDNILVNTRATDPRDLVDHLIELCRKSSDSSIYVGTIHSVKGLEYDIVHLLGVDGESFQIRGEEMRNLYYVGVTRAKSKLYVYKEF